MHSHPEAADTLIIDAQLYDGTGAPPVERDVAVRDGKIVAIGNLSNWLAEEVIDRDDEVDKLYKRSIKLLQTEMRADPEIIRPGTRYLFVLASLERVGDRAGNIAWHTKDMIGAE